jgi:hypothetical protein
MKITYSNATINFDRCFFIALASDGVSLLPEPVSTRTNYLLSLTVH